MPKISPCLWFDTQAEEAANFYVSVFNNSKIVNMNRCGEARPDPKGSVMTVVFQLDIALNGGPLFKFTEAVSFIVNCKTQEEVDSYWQSCWQAERKAGVAGSRINLACHGKSFPFSWAKCFVTRIRKKPNESWKPCSR